MRPSRRFSDPNNSAAEKPGAGWAFMVLGMLIVLAIAGAIYRHLHPIPPADRLFTPEWNCHTGVRGYCERVGPKPPAWPFQK
jgi:hypothetical protein